ncbi:MAG: hypothetical protein Q7J07_02895 [Pelolinea sp.]|nr:hypothetical protein [Pelolinea sp.]
MNNNTDYALIQNKDITENEYSLSFGEKIVSIISKFDNKIYCDQISFHDRSGRHFQVNKMDLAFDIDHSKRESRPLFPKYITEPDAMFLSDLGGDGKEMIRSFFIDEVKLFLCSELSIANCDANLLTHEKQDHEKFSNSLKKTNHSNYNRGIAISKLFSNTIYRKHKHSVYPFLKKQTMSIGDIQDRQQEMDAVVRKLLLYLNKQLRSFFHTSNILIKLNDIDESSAVTRFSKIANNSFPF